MQAYIAEYGSITADQYGKKITLQTATKERREYRLIHRTAGYQIAGSCARLDKEAWGVLFEFDGAEHGRWFKTLPEASDLFAKWTA